MSEIIEKSPLILASSSPRRRELIGRIVTDHHAIAAAVDEDGLTAANQHLAPDQLVLLLAREKARVISSCHSEAVVIGADTLVVLEGEVLGKPLDFEAAVAMLQSEQGKTQTVMTGLALVQGGEILEQTVVTSRVAMRSLNREEIVRYVNTGKAYDKAGGYGIQEEARDFVAWYEGCFFNIIGLPLCELAALLRRSPASGLLREPLVLPPKCLNTKRIYVTGK